MLIAESMQLAWDVHMQFFQLFCMLKHFYNNNIRGTFFSQANGNYDMFQYIELESSFKSIGFTSEN